MDEHTDTQTLALLSSDEQEDQEVDGSDWTVWDLEQDLYLVAIRY
jgi:hypothetical protein